MQNLLDGELILHLKGMFEAALNPNAQEAIYKDLQNMIENVPNVLFDILAILSDESIGQNIRFVAVATLRNYHNNVPEDSKPIFLQNVFTYLESAIQNPESVLTSQLQALFATMFSTYSSQYYENPSSVVFDLLSKDNTASLGMQCMQDQIQHNVLPTDDLLQHLLRFIVDNYAATKLCEQSLQVINSLLLKWPENYLQFGLEHVLAAIDEFAVKYNAKALSYGYSILGIVFYHTSDETLAELVANLIQTQDQTTLIDLMEAFMSFEIIPFDVNIVAALFIRLADQDESGEGSDFAFMCQFVLHNLSLENPERVSEIIMPLLSQCENDAQIIRTIATIDMEPQNPQDFIPLILQHLEDELRGDSVLCLQNICLNDPSYASSTAEVIIPLMQDNDSDVRDKVYFTLKEIFPCQDAKAEWLEPLFNNLKVLPETITVMQILSQFLECDLVFPESHIEELLGYFIELFITGEVEGSLLRTIAVILSQLIQKHETVAHSIAEQIICRSNELIEIINDDLYESLCGLINSLYCRIGIPLNGEQFFITFVQLMTKVMPARWNSITKEESFGFMATLFKFAPEMTQEFVGHWLVVTAYFFEKTSVMSIPTICNFWISHIKMFDRQHTMALTSGVCNLYAKRFSEVDSKSELFSLLSHLISHLQEFGPVEPNIIGFYNSLQQVFSNSEE